jgi:hypothetical protein
VLGVVQCRALDILIGSLSHLLLVCSCGHVHPNDLQRSAVWWSEAHMYQVPIEVRRDGHLLCAVVSSMAFGNGYEHPRLLSLGGPA